MTGREVGLGKYTPSNHNGLHSHLDDDGCEAALKLLDNNPERVEVLVELLGIHIHHVILHALDKWGGSHTSCLAWPLE